MLAKARALLITDPLILASIAAMGAVSLVVSFFDAGGRRQHRVAQTWARMLLKIAGVRLDVGGLERIAAGGVYVFAANHRSFIDIPVALASIPSQFRFLANDYLFNWPFIGYHLRRAGHFPVAQADARESLKTMSAAARAAGEQRVSIFLFPEGGRTDGEMMPFRDGAAYIAIKAGIPLVPVAMIGVRPVLPRGSAIVTGGLVKVRIGEPIRTRSLTLRDRAAVTQQLYEAVAELHGEPAHAL
jgi:1-acyl-sn-glycerol-3-phosphate acyltransferase